jgi:hypothetical protein
MIKNAAIISAGGINKNRRLSMLRIIQHCGVRINNYFAVRPRLVQKREKNFYVENEYFLKMAAKWKMTKMKSKPVKNDVKLE